MWYPRTSARAVFDEFSTSDTPSATRSKLLHSYRRFRHGEAIALGMLAAADLAVVRGAMAERERAALAQLITKLGPLPSVADLPIPEAIEAIRRDKKVVHGRLHFVIAIEIGATMTVDDVSEDELRAVLVRLGLKN